MASPPSDGLHLLMCLQTDTLNNNFYLYYNTNIFSVSYHPLKVYIVNWSATPAGALTGTLMLDNEFLAAKTGTGQAISDPLLTRLELFDAGTVGGEQVYVIQASYMDNGKTVNGYLSVPTGGAPSISPMHFETPASGSPANAPLRQKWVFKPVRSPDIKYKMK